MRIFLSLLTICIVAQSHASTAGIEATLEKARSIKSESSESSVGFILSDLEDNSIFKNLGLKSGDKIHKINRQEVNNLSDIMSNIDNVESLEVTRKEDSDLIEVIFTNM
jgi:type II secretory pathway component PulC